MKKLKTLKVKAFTLVEMLVVLLIISVLMLLFVPNLITEKQVASYKAYYGKNSSEARAVAD